MYLCSVNYNYRLTIFPLNFVPFLSIILAPALMVNKNSNNKNNIRVDLLKCARYIFSYERNWIKHTYKRLKAEQKYKKKNNKVQRRNNKNQGRQLLQLNLHLYSPFKVHFDRHKFALVFTLSLPHVCVWMWITVCVLISERHFIILEICIQ
jgi:hypothetical protein